MRTQIERKHRNDTPSSGFDIWGNPILVPNIEDLEEDQDQEEEQEQDQSEDEDDFCTC